MSLSLIRDSVMLCFTSKQEISSKTSYKLDAVYFPYKGKRYNLGKDELVYEKIKHKKLRISAGNKTRWPVHSVKSINLEANKNFIL